MLHRSNDPGQPGGGSAEALHGPDGHRAPFARRGRANQPDGGHPGQARGLPLLRGKGKVNVLRLSFAEATALREAFNLGMRDAAATMSQLANATIDLSVPEVEPIGLEDLAPRIGWPREQLVCGVLEEFHGPFRGDALLLFPERQGRVLLRSLLSLDECLEALSEMEQDALREVGNIILNAVVAALAKLLGTAIATDLPVYIHRPAGELIQTGATPGSEALLLPVDFQSAARVHAGYIVLAMESAAGKTFKNRLKSLLS